MAWRDNLRPASFRGIPFAVDGTSLSFGRRQARHEYPQRDIPYIEDMGRKAREYRIEAIIIGADYMSGRDRLIKAIEEAGPGQLVHPYHGTMQVTAAPDVQLTESTREGGMARFSITFIEAGQQDLPDASTDTESVLTDQYLSTENAIADDFAEKFSVDGAVDFVVQDGLDSINNLLTLPSMSLGSLPLLRANPLSPLTALLPENLLASLGNPGGLALGVLAMVRAATDITSLFNFSLPTLSTSISTPSRLAQADNRVAINNLVLQAATSRRIVDLASSAPATLDDARAARAEIVSRADTVLLDPTTGQHAADAIVQLRTDAVRHFSRQTADLPRLVSVTNQATLPAIVVAYDFYGDDWAAAVADDDLVIRNRIRHPGFVSAGQALQLLAS
jgi:prophage DNA circulation protein